MSSDQSRTREQIVEDDWQSQIGRWTFRAVWRCLAAEDMCDTMGGAESRRVETEWQEAGRPRDVYGFIRRRANIDATGNNQEGESHD